jgi:phasin family protein
MLTVEQILAAQKESVEALLGLTAKAFEGVEKIVELNLSASKTALTESGDSAKAILSAKDAQELLAAQTALLQPLSEKTAAYSRQLYEITSGSTANLGKSFEEQTAESQKKFLALIDTAVQNAPAGSESAVAILKNAVTAANSALESIQKTVKQAAETAETNFNTVASMTEAGRTATKKR